jgi:thioredoxin reductase (NADPH)
VVETFDVVIVGGGPAGLAAGLYAARMNLRAVLVERGPLGGQLLNTELIEDYPGFESILGGELAEKMGCHAGKFGLDIRQFQAVSAVEVEEGRGLKVRLQDGGELRAPAVIMAAGGLPRRLGVPGEEEFAGRGVSYCAVCDGAFFKNQVLAVVGGGDAALEEADFLTRYASKVYVIHRRDEFRAQPILQERARANSKIDFILNAQVKEIYGDQQTRGVRYIQDGVERDLPVGGVFIFIGFVPNSDLVKAHLDHDEGGYIITDRDLRTSIEGIWAVGDVRAQLTKQIATAVGDGTTAAVAASQYIDHLRHQERVAEAARLSS